MTRRKQSRPYRIKMCWHIAVLLVALSMLHLGATPTTEPSEVAGLVSQLGADDWPDREKAEDSLVDLGDDIIPAMKRVVKTTSDPEIRGRALSVIARIDRNRQLLGTMIEGGRFDSPAAAFKHLAKSLHFELQYVTNDARRKAEVKKPVVITGKRKTLLQTVDELILATRLDCLIVGQRIVVQNFPPATMGLPTRYSGAIALRVLQAKRERSLRYTTGESPETLGLVLRMDFEQKTKLVGDNSSIEFKRIDDEAGRSLLTDGNRSIQLGRFANSYQGALALSALTRASKRIAVLEGVLHSNAIQGSKRYVIDDLSELPKTLEFGEWTVNVSLKDRPDHRQQIEFEFVGDSAVKIDANGDRWGNLDQDKLFPENSLRVEDSDGKPMLLTKQKQYSENGWPIEPFLIDRDPTTKAQPKSLTWDSVAETRDVEMPFTFTNLALP